jgi:hypothetical protein
LLYKREGPNSKILEKMHEDIKRQIEEGVIEEVDENVKDGPIHYIPFIVSIKCQIREN